MTTDLAQFVSDYCRISPDSWNRKPTASEVAQAYIENDNLPGDKETLQRITEQVAYYMP